MQKGAVGLLLSEVSYIYGFELSPENLPPDPFQLGGVAVPGNSVRLLEERNITLRLGFLGFDVNEDVGAMRLRRLGACRWTKDDLSLAREWHAPLFATVANAKADALEWQCSDYFTSYAVAPVVHEDDAYHLDFGSMRALVDGKTCCELHSTLPKSHRGVQRHVEKVEGALGARSYEQEKRQIGPVFAGCAKHNTSPIFQCLLK